jgi:hypothetical protein
MIRNLVDAHRLAFFSAIFIIFNFENEMAEYKWEKKRSSALIGRDCVLDGNCSYYAE